MLGAACTAFSSSGPGDLVRQIAGHHVRLAAALRTRSRSRRLLASSSRICSRPASTSRGQLLPERRHQIAVALDRQHVAHAARRAAAESAPRAPPRARPRCRPRPRTPRRCAPDSRSSAKKFCPKLYLGLSPYRSSNAFGLRLLGRCLARIRALARWPFAQCSLLRPAQQGCGACESGSPELLAADLVLGCPAGQPEQDPAYPSVLRASSAWGAASPSVSPSAWAVLA